MTNNSEQENQAIEAEDVLQLTEVEEETDTQSKPEAEDQDALPQELPILPLRGVVVYPLTAIPLTVGQERSLKLVDDIGSGQMVGLVTSLDEELDVPGPDEVHRVGTLATIHRLFRLPDGNIRLLVQGVSRLKIDEFVDEQPYLKATVSVHPEKTEKTREVEALMRTVSDQFSRLADLVPNIPAELASSTVNTDDPLQLAYTVSTYVRIDVEEAQSLLEMQDVREKLLRLTEILSKEIEVLELGRKIQSDAQTEMEKTQKDYYLREQMKAIQRELGDGDELADVEMFRQKLDELNLPEEADQEARRELDRLSRLPAAAAEYGVIRTYLDWVVSLPWNTRSEDHLDINNARQVLDADHYGLEEIKERILEFLAVRKLRAERAEENAEEAKDYIRRQREGAILCFVGPPGVGKTSLGASIARAMGREFIRMSLGGVRDETEIRGFRRTYIGALPGRIIQTLRRVGTRNPLIMLDEVDKLGRDYRGDPSSALLEVLDPEQNAEFRDHYLDVAFDLSEVMFITTANSLDTIPGPLRDRMEIIPLSGYTEQEKVSIASQYLVARQIRENGLRPSELSFTDEAILTIIRDYTREAGVRSLEREIGRAARKVVTKIASGQVESFTVDKEAVRDLLGKSKVGYHTEIQDRTDQPGVATGVAWTPYGGDVLFIEASRMAGGKGFQYTGQLGDVMQESAKLALTYIRAHAEDLNIDPQFHTNTDIHLHVPSGAQPKDGPSAGVTIATALVSLLTNKPTKSNVAMTGEITLQGKVLPVGGIKDKVLAAHRLGVDTFILPKKNDVDLDDVPDEVRSALTFVLADTLDDVFKVALTN
jgi:ATP-dependent Lon protease